MHRYLWTVLLAVVTLALFTLGLVGVAGARDGSGYEVWAVDQSNTNGTTSGGTIHVYDGRDLEGRDASGAVAERIDLTAAVALCVAQTGTAPVRPHMLFFNTAESHAVVAFVASGHVLFLDADDRTPLACIDVGVQAHAAVPSPDGSYVVVANQNGKLLQRISTDYTTNTFTLESSATLDLANGTTPTGALRQDPVLRPDNAPICPLIDSTSRLTFVTLRGGGLFVVDSKATPMRIVAEYDRETIHGNGCGGIESDGKMYLDSGGGTATNLNEFDVYAFTLADFRLPAEAVCTFAQPNTPAAKLVVSQDDREHTDAHGVTLTKHGRYLWVADRAGNRIVVIETKTDQVVDEISLAGTISSDPSPDLLALAPAGNRMFATLRGSLPLSGDPHASTGSTPGLGVIRVQQGGRSGELLAIARISNVDAGGIDRADPHGLRIREK
jgi:DNA-binding beta-propeller fold protein YncE